MADAERGAQGEAGGIRGEAGGGRVTTVDLDSSLRALRAKRTELLNQVDAIDTALAALAAASFAAYAACFSLRAAFRVCHDLCSVFGFAFSRFFDSRLAGVVVAI